jgi:oligopeptide/dipeptide ABC transporter ATP-binding protein
LPIPDPRLERQRTKTLLKGELPSPSNPPSGCVFRTRCPLASAECARERPALREVAAGHFAACIKIPVAASSAVESLAAPLHSARNGPEAAPLH